MKIQNKEHLEGIHRVLETFVKENDIPMRLFQMYSYVAYDNLDRQEGVALTPEDYEQGEEEVKAIALKMYHDAKQDYRAYCGTDLNVETMEGFDTFLKLTDGYHKSLFNIRLSRAFSIWDTECWSTSRHPIELLDYIRLHKHDFESVYFIFFTWDNIEDDDIMVINAMNLLTRYLGSSEQENNTTHTHRGLVSLCVLSFY